MGTPRRPRRMAGHPRRVPRSGRRRSTAVRDLASRSRLGRVRRGRRLRFVAHPASHLSRGPGRTQRPHRSAAGTHVADDRASIRVALALGIRCSSCVSPTGSPVHDGARPAPGRRPTGPRELADPPPDPTAGRGPDPRGTSAGSLTGSDCSWSRTSPRSGVRGPRRRDRPERSAPGRRRHWLRTASADRSQQSARRRRPRVDRRCPWLQRRFGRRGRSASSTSLDNDGPKATSDVHAPLLGVS